MTVIEKKLNYEKFFLNVKKVLNHNQVIPSEEAEIKYGKTTFGTSERSIFGAILPNSKEDVISVVKSASEFGVSLYPISTGRNWGYGNASPVQDGSVIVDLSRMNQIQDVDEKLGLVRVQPGLTFRQLSNYLKKNKLKFLCPYTGAGLDTSLIGNALERGVSSAPYHDRFYSIMGIEAVLADGSLYNSITQGDDIKSLNFYKWGMGPYLDGIFGQSNFGIVTSATFSLAPTSESTESFFIEKKTTSDLVSFIDRTRLFLFDTGNTSLIRIHSYERFFLSWKNNNEIHQKRNWLIVGTIRGNKNIVKGMRKVVRSWYKGEYRQLFFFSRGFVKILSKIVEKFPSMEKFIPHFPVIMTSLNIFSQKDKLEGSENHIPQIDSDGKMFRVDDPRVGLIFFYATAPMKGDVVVNFLDLAESICKKHNFFPYIVLRNISERCILLSIRIVFEKQSKIRVENAQKCYQELVQVAPASGVFQCRMNIDSMNILDRELPFWKVVARIKKELDPKNIISPGRYGP